MVKITGKNTPKTGIRGQLGSLVSEIGVETLKSVKEIGKEVVKGVTMLPQELIVNALTGSGGQSGEGKEKSWADEWLKDKDKDTKDKPPLAGKEGEHSSINPAEIMQKNDKAKEEAIKRQLMGALHGQYSRPSATSSYGQQQAQQAQQKQMSAFDKMKQEDEQKKQQQAQMAASGGSSLAQPQGKKKLGMGQKRQKTPMTGIENKAAKGKQ